MTPGQMTDARGSTLALTRRVPGWGYEICVTSNDGPAAVYEASPEELGALAACFVKAASTPERLARAQTSKVVHRAKAGTPLSE